MDWKPQGEVIVCGIAPISKILLWVAEVYAKCELGDEPLRFEIVRARVEDKS